MSRHYKRWSKDELQLLRETYPAKGSAVCASLLGRSERAVLTRASEEKLSRRDPLATWTAERIADLCAAFSSSTPLPDTGERFGLTRWQMMRIAEARGWTHAPAKRGPKPRAGGPRADPVQDAMDAIRRRVEREIAADTERNSAQGLAPRATEENLPHATAAE